MKQTTMTRAKRTKPHLVRVAGSAAGLDWGMTLGRRRGTVIDVVIVRAHSFTPPRRLTVPVTWVTAGSIMTAPEGVLANLVRAGTLSSDEYAAWMKRRVVDIIDAEQWMRQCRTRKVRGAPWHNLGKGMGTGETREFIR